MPRQINGDQGDAALRDRSSEKPGQICAEFASFFPAPANPELNLAGHSPVQPTYMPGRKTGPMEKTPQYSRRLRYVVLATLAIGSLTFLIYAGVHAALGSNVNRSLVQSGTVAGERWSAHLAEAVPDLERVVEGGLPNNYQAYKLEEALSVSDIFAFELYGPDGTRIHHSEILKDISTIASDQDAQAAQVFLGAKVEGVLEHETLLTGFPETFVVAYAPLKNYRGERLGAMKVYVDRSEAHAVLQGSISQLSVILPAACAIIYLIPALAFLMRTRQVWNAQENVRRLSDYDALTGLLNRTAFGKRLADLFETPRAEDKGIGIVFIDIDDFKTLNEEKGSETGDAYLQYLADTLRNSVRGKSDLMARVGGDEFIAAVPEISLAQLEDLSRRIQEATRLPFRHAGSEVTCQISIGLHLSTGDESWSRALYAADVALHYARSSTKDALIVYSDSMKRQLKERRELEAQLRTALIEDRFELLFQPFVARESERIVGFEALLRLPDGAGGSISPARFIPLAEEVGLIDEIGLWVLEKALSTASTWPDHIPISVNLSPHQFNSGDLVSRVADALARTGVPAHRLELEITESVLVADDESVDRQIVGLKQLGISIAMDDFGTGYSSLGYLMKYGFDKLKIDRSFLENLEFDPARHERIIDTIVDLGHNLEMKVTVEGVETRRQVELLRPMNCDFYQGYFFGKPMSAYDAQVVIKHEARDIPRSAGDAQQDPSIAEPRAQAS